MQVYVTDNFEVCINGVGVFSHSLFLIPLPPYIGEKWIIYHHTPLGVINALSCVEAAICPFFLLVPKQPQFDVRTEQRCTKAVAVVTPSTMG